MSQPTPNTPNPHDSKPSSPAPPVDRSSGGGGVIVVVIAVVAAIFLMGGCVIALLVALLFPAIGTARDAARRAQSINNVKNIGLSILNYETSHGQFPPQYTVDEQGAPLHSWRTLMLPYLEEQRLFDQIDREKAWDDPANGYLTDQPVPLYVSPRADDPPGMTNYVVIAGEGFLFNGNQQIGYGSIRDGTSNTIMVVEIVNSTIPWAKPEDITLDDLNWEAEGAPGDAPNLVRRDAVVGFADGSVLPLVSMEDRQWLQKRLTIAGGEAVEYVH